MSRRCCFLSMDDMGHYVADDDLATTSQKAFLMTLKETSEVSVMKLSDKSSGKFFRASNSATFIMFVIYLLFKFVFVSFLQYFGRYPSV